MNFTIIEAAQRSPEWFAARVGRITGSVAGDMLNKIKNGDYSAARRDLRIKLAVEQLTGVSSDDPDAWKGKDVERGMEMEPLIADAYEADQGFLLQKTGFLQMNGFLAGCSLDGHVNDFEGIVEFKSPRPATHLAYIEARKVPTEYVAQITHNLWVTGAKWCDFVSFSDQFPGNLDHLSFFRIRVMRDEASIKAYETEVIKFLAEVKIKAQELTALRAA
ncbi:MAG: YqaJ viral recombinase family protein [Terriglobia bacterium]|nr:YqaJ viral recombinase family protein [Terriglobia bacterium]